MKQNMTKYYDVTLPITDNMMVYPGDLPVRFKKTKTIAKDGYNWSEIQCGTHIGTHIDVPNHFVENAATLDDLPYELMIGNVLVVETDADMITREVLENVNLKETEVVFFKTKNQKLWELKEFSKEYVSLESSAAEFLVEHKIKMVGIDYKSIETFYSHEYPVHRILLEKGIFIIEGLYLNEVPASQYKLYCFPLRLAGADGGPVRVVLEA